MAVLELTDKPFFADKNRAFWNLHSAGWAGAVILRAASGIAQGQPVSFLVPILISAVTGYSITLLLSVIYRFLIGQRPFITWSLTFVSVSLATIGYAYIDVWVLQTIRDGVDETQGDHLAGLRRIVVDRGFNILSGHLARDDRLGAHPVAGPRARRRSPSK